MQVLSEGHPVLHCPPGLPWGGQRYAGDLEGVFDVSVEALVKFPDLEMTGRSYHWVDSVG